MTEPAKKTEMPRWLATALVTILACQVGLLWMQGTLLERQHGDLQGLREDVQDLTESLEQFEDAFDQGATDGAVRPSSRPILRHRAAVRVRLQEEGDQGVRKELADQRKSEREALDKARDARQKLSWEENQRKAEEKAKVEAEAHKLSPLIWVGVVVALLALFLRSWFRNRG